MFALPFLFYNSAAGRQEAAVIKELGAVGRLVLQAGVLTCRHCGAMLNTKRFKGSGGQQEEANSRTTPIPGE